MMKTTPFLSAVLIALTTAGAVALTTVPENFPITGGLPFVGGASDVVVIYDRNQVGLITTLPDAVSEQLARQPIDNALIRQLQEAVGIPVTPPSAKTVKTVIADTARPQEAGGTPVTSRRIADALAAYIDANPANAVSATAMALVIAHRANLSANDQISIIASGVQALARLGNGTAPTISTLIGFAAQIASVDQRAAVISDLRQIAIANMPEGSPTERALTVDLLLVQDNVLEPATIPPESVPILLAQVNQTTVVAELLTPFTFAETEVGQIAAAAPSAGQGLGANPFGTGGAIGTPTNPAGIGNQPAPAPTPTPPPPYGL